MERRVVTSFFVDVVGSTALTVQLGSERFKRALDRAFLDLAACIAQEGGSIANTIGDAIFALFGLPAAHPDDPQRALRAALACIGWAEARGGEPVRLSVRIGVETGEVMVDLAAEGRGGQQTSIGTCVNLAARLQQYAEPGQILVGPTCHQIVAESADFISLGNVELKGLGLQSVWRLVSLRESAVRTHPPLIGRDEEMKWLRNAYQRTKDCGSAFVVISGPPGQGKTRLVEEFLAELTGDASVLQGRCRPAGELGARHPLRELLPLDGSDRSNKNLGDRLVVLVPDARERDRVLTALLHSAGAMVDPGLAALAAEQRRDEIENGWRRYLTALARTRPVVVWIDDIHWSEPETINLLQRVARGSSARILVIATARPELEIQLKGHGDSGHLFIRLAALREHHARALARSAGGAESLEIERAEGNPLFILELARARVKETTPDLPLTLKGIIGARLDELPHKDRELLQSASVVGETFTVSDAALLAGRDVGSIASAVDRLVDFSYLRRVPDGLKFQHALVHDVAYSRLATAERMRLHAMYARRGSSPNDWETIAHHAWEAVGAQDAEWVWENSEELSQLRRMARDAHLAASRRYTNRFAYERAIEACRRASMLAAGPEDAGRAEQMTATVYAAKGDADEAWRRYLRARASYHGAGLSPPPDLYPNLLEMPVYTSGMFRQLPDDALLEGLFREGEEAARRGNDAASLARLLALRAYRTHDTTRLSEALKISATAVDPDALGSFLEHAAIVQNRVGDFAGALRSYERLDTLAGPGAASDRQLEFRAVLALNMGQIKEAEDLAAQYLLVSASRGPHLRTHAFREQCHVLLARGDWGGLRDLAAATERLVSDHPETPFCYAVSTAFAFAAVASAIDGAMPEARAFFQRAETPMQAEPLERESILLLASAALGLPDKVDELRRLTHQRHPAPLWYFTRMEAVALTMLGRWAEVDEVLPNLERMAAKGDSLYLPALVAAIREEMRAAAGDDDAQHKVLRELGYAGWSRLISHRPRMQAA